MSLAGGDSEGEGYVMLRGEPMCDYHWNKAAGDVVCRQLGFSGLTKITLESEFGPVPSTKFSRHNLRCFGNETRVEDCQMMTMDDCPGGGGAGVLCWKGKF